MVIRKCLGTSKDSCFCGTSDDLSLCANWEWGGAKPGEGQPGHAQLTNFCFSFFLCCIAVEFLKAALSSSISLRALRVSLISAWLRFLLCSSIPSAARPAAF